MKKTVVRGIAGAMLAGAAVLATSAPALADDQGGVAIVDNPDNGSYNDIYTFAPLGVPVLGLIRSLNGVPGKILPSFGS